MRVLLRKMTNGFYFRGKNNWISNPQKAFDFGSIHAAIEYVGEADAGQFELALAFDGNKAISTMPLSAAFETFRAVAELGGGRCASDPSQVATGL